MTHASSEHPVVVIHRSVTRVAVRESSRRAATKAPPRAVTTHVQIPRTKVTPRGPPGTSGAAFSGYDHEQASAATVWTVNHNLGFRPDVATYRLGGTEMKGAVQHLSLNTVRITFNSPVAGYARVS